MGENVIRDADRSALITMRIIIQLVLTERSFGGSTCHPEQRGISRCSRQWSTAEQRVAAHQLFSAASDLRVTSRRTVSNGKVVSVSTFREIKRPCQQAAKREQNSIL
jgi:hypothetical protein